MSELLLGNQGLLLGAQNDDPPVFGGTFLVGKSAKLRLCSGTGDFHRGGTRLLVLQRLGVSERFQIGKPGGGVVTT